MTDNELLEVAEQESRLLLLVLSDTCRVLVSPELEFMRKEQVELSLKRIQEWIEAHD